jgi:hypothetical protein
MTLTQIVKATYAMVGQPIDDFQLAITVDKLKDYPFEDVSAALSRCQDELRRLTFADILDRLPGGHPGPEQAWALMAQAMHDESVSLIWSDEMREAYGAAHMVADDPIAARMTFKEVYTKAIAIARSQRVPITWTLSKGSDKAMLEAVIIQGVKEGKLLPEYAQRQLPNFTDSEARQMLAQYAPNLLT